MPDARRIPVFISLVSVSLLFLSFRGLADGIETGLISKPFAEGLPCWVMLVVLSSAAALYSIGVRRMIFVPFFLIAGLLLLCALGAENRCSDSINIASGLFLLAVWAYVAVQFHIRRNDPNVRMSFLPVFLLTAALLLPASAFTVMTCTTTGDEPHYLMITHSLMEDGDVNLANQYDEKAYSRFHRGELVPKPESDIVRENYVRSYALGFGFSSLLIPGYAVGERWGVALEIALIWAAGFTFVFLALIHCGLRRENVLAAYLMVLPCAPVIVYAGQVYPDSVAGALAALAFYIWVRYKERYFLKLTSLGAIACFLALMKVRFAPICLTLAFLAIIPKKLNRRRIILVSVATIALAFAFILFDRLFFGGDMFWIRFGSWRSLVGFLPGADSWRRFLGLLIDQEAGLLFTFPLGIVALFSLARYKSPPRSMRPFLFWVPVIYIFFVTGHRYWHSLPTPPPRYLVPLIPLFLASIAVRFDRAGKSDAVCRFLAGAGWLFGFLLLVHPAFRYSFIDGTGPIIESVSSALNLDFNRFFASMNRPNFAAVIWTLALIPAFMLVWRRGATRDADPQARTNETREQKRRAPQGLVFTAISLLLIASAIHFAVSLAPRNIYLADKPYRSESFALFPENPDPFYLDKARHCIVLQAGETATAQVKSAGSRVWVGFYARAVTDLDAAANTVPAEPPKALFIVNGKKKIFEIPADWDRAGIWLESEDQNLSISLKFISQSGNRLLLERFEVRKPGEKPTV